MPFSFKCKICRQIEHVATANCVCFKEELCNACFVADNIDESRVVDGNCPFCDKYVIETIGWYRSQGNHAGACVTCYTEIENCKKESAMKKAEFDAKPVREKMICLLDNIISCQDAYQPVTLNGYHACLSMMKNYAERRMDFEEEGEGHYLWNVLMAVEEIASKYEQHPSLEKCKEIVCSLQVLART